MKDHSSQYLSSKLDEKIFPAANMLERLLQHERDIPGKIVYILLEDGVHEKENIPYGLMVQKAKAIASKLLKNGKKGDRVLLLFPTGIEFITSFFGCFFAGMIAVPAYPPRRNKANERFHSIVGDARPSFILTTEALKDEMHKHELLANLSSEIFVYTYEKIEVTQAGTWVDPGINGDDIALLQYTSGSTGTPRGVMVSHANIIHNSEFIKQSFGFDENSVGVNWLPNFHDMGLIGCLVQAAYLGATNVIIPPLEFIKNPANWLRSMTKFRATTGGGPNFAFDHCVEKIKGEELQGLDLSKLKTLYCGAEPIRDSSLKSFAHSFNETGFLASQIFPVYGMAESVLIITGGDYREEPIYLSLDVSEMEKNHVKVVEKNAASRTLTACGYPWLGMSIAIVDPELKKLCPAGEIGEIWAKGPSVAKGYWNDPEETEQTFNAYIKDTDDGPWLRTGDLGFIHEGQLYVSGRLKDLIIIRGSNFFPNDIEFSLENAHEAIRKNASAAFSVDIDAEEKLVLVAEIERTFMRNLPEDEIFEAIRTAVFAEHGIQPHAIALIRTGSILKTSSGKIRRYAVKKAWLNDELTIVAARKIKKETGPMKRPIGYRPEFLREWMINWMAQNLEIDPASIDPAKPVSAYGLDSIAAVSLERDVNNQFGVEWPIESFLMDKSIDQLVEEGMRMLHSKT